MSFFRTSSYSYFRTYSYSFTSNVIGPNNVISMNG